MRSVLRPVTSRATWTRAVHLALGLWLAAACAFVWPGLDDMSARTVIGMYLAPLPVLTVLAAVPVVRRSEGIQARALLLPGNDEITVEPARTWPDRGRVLLWLVVRVELGVLAGQLTALAVATAWSLPRRSSGLAAAAGLPAWAGLPPAGAVLLVLVYALAGLGGLTAAVARRLLSPSPGERLAAQQARTERLLERTRLAAELHDSIGHALTVTLLQAGAAREVAGRNPAFVDGALAAIEDSARTAVADLDRVLALLRESAPPPDAPTLSAIHALVRSTEAAGAPVELHVSGPMADVPPIVSREAYRIVQEALTNALRHAGPVPVELRVEVGTQDLRLDVRNPVPPAVPTRGGSGSGVGTLHRRAAVLGGSAHAGPTGDGWQVSVRLPLTQSP